MIKFLKTKKINRRGVALEMVILVILVTFILTTLLVSTSMFSTVYTRKSLSDLSNKMQLDQLGNEFLSTVGSEQDFNDLQQKYIGEFDLQLQKNQELNLWTFNAKNLNDNSVELEIVLSVDTSNQSYTILKWNY